MPEAVQQRPVRAISGLRATTYEEKLKELMMPSLQERRNEIDMVQTYKIVMGIDMVNCDLWFERACKRRPTRNNIVRHNLVPRRSNHEYRRQFFSSRGWTGGTIYPHRSERPYKRHTQATLAPAMNG